MTSDLDLSDAKNQLAAAKAELDAINKKITAESKEGDRSPESGKKRKQYLIDLKGKVSNMELKLTKYELDQDLE